MSGINSVKNYKYSILVKKNRGIKKTKKKTKKCGLEPPVIHTTNYPVLCTLKYFQHLLLTFNNVSNI